LGGFGLFSARKLQGISDISPLSRLQILLGVVENLPAKVTELRLGLAVVVEGFQVYNYRGVVAVQLLPSATMFRAITQGRSLDAERTWSGVMPNIIAVVSTR